MNAIFYDYFIGKLIILGFLFVGVYIYRKNELNKIIPILIITLASIFMIFNFIRPSIFNNVKLFNSLMNLNKDEVSYIKIYDQDNFLIKEYKKSSEINNILNLIKQNKSYSGNISQTNKAYSLKIFLKNKKPIIFSVLETETTGVIVFLFNQFNNSDYIIGTYQNNFLNIGSDTNR